MGCQTKELAHGLPSRGGRVARYTKQKKSPAAPHMGSNSGRNIPVCTSAQVGDQKFDVAAFAPANFCEPARPKLPFIVYIVHQTHACQPTHVIRGRLPPHPSFLPPYFLQRQCFSEVQPVTPANQLTLGCKNQTVEHPKTSEPLCCILHIPLWGIKSNTCTSKFLKICITNKQRGGRAGIFGGLCVASMQFMRGLFGKGFL